jgi:hypothetical protein
MAERDPHDGQPYYCTLCGAGWNEYGACEEPDCKLETVEAAQARAQKKRKVTSDTATMMQGRSYD